MMDKNTIHYANARYHSQSTRQTHPVTLHTKWLKSYRQDILRISHNRLCPRKNGTHLRRRTCHWYDRLKPKGFTPKTISDDPRTSVALQATWQPPRGTTCCATAKPTPAVVMKPVVSNRDTTGRGTQNNIGRSSSPTSF